jgi:hypothetical protein
VRRNSEYSRSVNLSVAGLVRSHAEPAVLTLQSGNLPAIDEWIKGDVSLSVESVPKLHILFCYDVLH